MRTPFNWIATAICFRYLNTGEVFVWVCFLCNNKFESEGDNDGVTEFGTVLNKIGRVICVVDDYLAFQQCTSNACGQYLR